MTAMQLNKNALRNRYERTTFVESLVSTTFARF